MVLSSEINCILIGSLVRVCLFQPAKDSHFIVYNIINMIWDGNGKEWEFSYGNNMGMGISEKMGMGMGGNRNR